MTPRGLRLGFCRGRKGYIGNIWLARHNRYQMLLQVRGRLWVNNGPDGPETRLLLYPGKRTSSDRPACLKGAKKRRTALQQKARITWRHSANMAVGANSDRT